MSDEIKNEKINVIPITDIERELIYNRNVYVLYHLEGVDDTFVGIMDPDRIRKETSIVNIWSLHEATSLGYFLEVTKSTEVRPLYELTITPVRTLDSYRILNDKKEPLEKYISDDKYITRPKILIK